jgi:hypothetical protein
MSPTVWAKEERRSRKNEKKKRNQFFPHSPGIPHIPAPQPPPPPIGPHGAAAALPPLPICAENVEYCCSSFSPPHPGHATFGALARTSFSNCFPQSSQRYS